MRFSACFPNCFEVQRAHYSNNYLNETCACDFIVPNFEILNL